MASKTDLENLENIMLTGPDGEGLIICSPLIQIQRSSVLYLSDEFGTTVYKLKFSIEEVDEILRDRVLGHSTLGHPWDKETNDL